MEKDNYIKKESIFLTIEDIDKIPESKKNCICRIVKENIIATGFL